jgi:hypothetical protein
VTPHDLAHAECELCGRSTWWRSRFSVGPWICAACVPPELEPHHVEWRESQLASEVTP